MLAAATGCGAAGKNAQGPRRENNGAPSAKTDPYSKLKAHSAWVHCLAISLDGKTLASGNQDKTIKLWGLPEGTPGACLFGPALTERGRRRGNTGRRGKGYSPFAHSIADQI